MGGKATLIKENEFWPWSICEWTARVATGSSVVKVSEPLCCSRRRQSSAEQNWSFRSRHPGLLFRRSVSVSVSLNVSNVVHLWNGNDNTCHCAGVVGEEWTYERGWTEIRVQWQCATRELLPYDSIVWIATHYVYIYLIIIIYYSYTML